MEPAMNITFGFNACLDARFTSKNYL